MSLYMTMHGGGANAKSQVNMHTCTDVCTHSNQDNGPYEA